MVSNVWLCSVSKKVTVLKCETLVLVHVKRSVVSLESKAADSNILSLLCPLTFSLPLSPLVCFKIRDIFLWWQLEGKPCVPWNSELLRGYGLGVDVYVLMCYMPMWVSVHRRTQCVSAPADWGNELGPPEVIVHVQAQTRIGLFQSMTD